MLNKNKGSSHSSITICLDIWLTAEKTFQVDNIFAHQLHLGHNGLYELNSTEL